jgi:ABC-2 type transport system ATP-binding protein
MAVIGCKQLAKFYGQVIGLNGVTVDVQPGVTGLLGPNGAGKTTMLRLATGLARPTQGAIEVLGENPWNNPDLMRRIGYVPEVDAPWPELPGGEAVERAARLSGLPLERAQERTRKVLEQVGLQGAAERLVGTYSRGMRQRLKVAMALVHEPELLILDEPLLGCDPISRRDIIQVIKGLAAQGTSVVVSTHVLPDVEAMTHRVLVLNHGRLMAHGDVEEIRNLLDRYPRTVRIETPQPRELGAALSQWPSVQGVEPEANALVVKTKQPAEFHAELQKFLVAKDIPFTSVTSPDDTVEAIFRYLVG